MHTPPAPAYEPNLIDALREDLARSGWTPDGVAALVGEVAARALEREQTVPALLRTAQPGLATEPAAVLLRLFQLGHPVSAQLLDSALPRTGTEGMERLGLVAREGDAVRAVVELAPYAAQDAVGPMEWWIASDLSETARLGAGAAGTLSADHVLGVGGASGTLAQLTVRRRVGSVLDLGTGCGIQALHAARHGGRVVATDIDPRALAFARFNAALAGVRLELRQGSMLEPVAGETFDLVVSNPPFVITPRGAGLAEFTYRDGGATGDALVADLVRGLAGVLAPGGVAQLLGNWEHRRGEPWTQRVAGWVSGTGLDAWVVEREVQDPAEYAELWLRDGGQTPERDSVGYARAYSAWLTDLASRDVEGIGFGFVTLRRPAAPREPWVRLEEVTGTVNQPLGGEIERVLDAVEDVWTVSAEELLARRWVVAADVTEERFHRPGEASPSVIVLHAGGGFGRRVRCDTALAAFVGACDGELSGGQISAALAALLEVDAGALAAELVGQVRGLAIDGLLLPAR